ncbi:MAG: hypothetical protein LBU23_13145 [Planctomycetota bacterium]|jgi:hypothetical protein|nr:hypothetical protein [Planctomycetota bacterium]
MTAEDEPARRLAEVEARERAVERRERAAGAEGLRHNLYARVNLSRRAVDAVIVACAVLIAVLAAVGYYFGKYRGSLP